MDSIEVSKARSEKLFFGADLHAGHDKLAKLRGFQSGDKMNDNIIRRWNLKVPHDGLVILLGDISFMNTAKTIEFLDELNGVKILVRGNHDKSLKGRVKSQFQSIHDLLNVKVEKDDGTFQRIACCHYPMLVWDQSHHGAVHLHGHSHATCKYPNPKAKILDVGFENAQTTGKPVFSFNEIMAIMANRELVANDHHAP